MGWLRLGSACIVIAACGRLGFEPIGGDAALSGDADGDVVFVPSCEPRPGALFWTTLDDLAAVEQPAIGSPNGTSATSQSFVGGRCGNGLQLDTPGEVIEIDQVDGGFSHFDFATGALEWWYRPLYTITDGGEHRLFGCTDAQQGGIRIGKRPATDGNVFAVDVSATNGSQSRTAVPSSGVPFEAGVWVHISVSWDFTVAVGARHVRILFDGIEPAYAERGTGAMSLPSAADSESCFVGGFDIDDTDSALGVFDEVVVYPTPR